MIEVTDKEKVGDQLRFSGTMYIYIHYTTGLLHLSSTGCKPKPRRPARIHVNPKTLFNPNRTVVGICLGYIIACHKIERGIAVL